jgi:hypothetical protein
MTATCAPMRRYGQRPDHSQSLRNSIWFVISSAGLVANQFEQPAHLLTDGVTLLLGKNNP